MTAGHRHNNRYVTDSYIDKLRAVQPLARAALRKLDRSLPVEIPDAGIKECRRCGEHLPATDEFFYRSAQSGNLRSPCRACIDEKRAATNAIKPCAIPGCTDPRHNSRSSYCWAHRFGSRAYYLAMAEKEARL